MVMKVMEVLPCSDSDGDSSEKNSNNKESFLSKRKPLSKVLKSLDKEVLALASLKKRVASNDKKSAKIICIHLIVGA